MKKSTLTQNDASQYPASSTNWHLAEDEVQIWCVSLERPAQVVAEFAALLSPDERARADRFHFERHRNRYIIGRGTLRKLISNYLGLATSKIVFVYGEHGKPAVEWESQNNGFHFNLAHSNTWALYAFGWNHNLGIDLEHIRPLQDADDFAKRFFSTRESALISSLPVDRKWEAFYKLWTCKEAFLKANGKGLTVPLNQAEIDLSGTGTSALISIGGNKKEAAKWHVETFQILAGYQSALAVEGRNKRLLFQSSSLPSV